MIYIPNGVMDLYLSGECSDLTFRNPVPLPGRTPR